MPRTQLKYPCFFRGPTHSLACVTAATWTSPLAPMSPRLLGTVSSGLHLCHEEITEPHFSLSIFFFPTLKLLWLVLNEWPSGLARYPATLSPRPKAIGLTQSLYQKPHPCTLPDTLPSPAPNKWCNQRQLFKLGERSPPSLHPASGQDGEGLKGGGLAARTLEYWGLHPQYLPYMANPGQGLSMLWTSSGSGPICTLSPYFQPWSSKVEGEGWK